MEFRPKQAIYIQLADHVCENILRGEWPEGARIPSIREFAVFAEVNPNTISRTYAHLQDVGISCTERGTGFFVASGAIAATIKLKRDHFFAQDLPEIVKTMTLLGISLEEFQASVEGLIT